MRIVLLCDVGTEGWLIGFECPAHGRGGALSPEWQRLINEVIESKTREGFDIAGALQALRDEQKRQGAYEESIGELLCVS